MTYYNSKSGASASEIIVTKFDDDFHPVTSHEGIASYTTTRDTCTCPAGHRPTCRHRQMWPILMTIKDLYQFYDFETGHVVKMEPQE